jgi:hypothetical protein
MVFFLVFPMVLTACQFESEEQKAMSACMSEIAPEATLITVEELVAQLHDLGEKEDWPLRCQKWASLARIAYLEQLINDEKANLERIDAAIEAAERVEANAAKTATARAIPSRTPIATATPQTTPTAATETP